MFASKIVEIILGVVIWKLLPGWISFNSKESRETVQAICNIVGIALVIIGVVGLLLAIL